MKLLLSYSGQIKMTSSFRDYIQHLNGWNEIADVISEWF